KTSYQPDVWVQKHPDYFVRLWQKEFAKTSEPIWLKYETYRPEHFRIQAGFQVVIRPTEAITTKRNSNSNAPTSTRTASTSSSAQFSSVNLPQQRRNSTASSLTTRKDPPPPRILCHSCNTSVVVPAEDAMDQNVDEDEDETEVAPPL